jgi:hypothetical protein
LPREWSAETPPAPLKDYNLGNLGNTIAGAIGGVGGGQLLQALLPAIASALERTRPRFGRRD